MPIFKSDSQMNALYLGDKPIVRAYKGEEIIYSSGASENIYVFNTALITNTLYPRTIMLQKDSRDGKSSTNYITDWGDGTKDNLLHHTYATHGIYRVKTKYSINSTNDVVSSGTYERTFDGSKELSEYERLEIDSKRGYYKAIEPSEIDRCFSHYLAASDHKMSFYYGPRGKDSASTHFYPLITEEDSYEEIYGSESDFDRQRLSFDGESFIIEHKPGNWEYHANIFPVYFIHDGETYTTKEGFVLTPGVWCNYNLNPVANEVRDLRIYYIRYYFEDAAIGYMNTREALIEAAGINSKQKTLKNMYYGCTNLKTVNVEDPKAWNLKNVTSLESMFNRCTSLQEFDLDSWDLSNVTCIKDMFADAKISPAVSLEDDGNRIVIDVADYGSDDFNYEQMGGSYSRYYKVSEIDDITEQHILGSGHILYYIGNNHYASGLNSLDEEDFGPGSFVKSEEVQDGVTKSWYIYKTAKYSQRTLVIATITGYYDAARKIQFSPGIWIYVDTKTNSAHGHIWAAKQIIFEGDLLPQPYIIEFDPANIDEYTEYWGSGTAGLYYKIAEAEEIPDENYLTGRGSMVMYYGDREEYASYDFTQLTWVNTHATSSDKTYYTPAIGDSSITRTSQAMLFMPYGMANWDPRFTPGIWLDVTYPNRDGNIDTAIYATKVKLYGDDRKIYKFNYSESDNRGVYQYYQIDNQEDYSKEYYFITYSGLPAHKYLLGNAVIKWDEKTNGVTKEKRATVPLTVTVNEQGDRPVIVYSARMPESEEDLFIIGYDDNSSIYNNNSLAHGNVTLDCIGIWAVCRINSDGSSIIPKELRLNEGTVDHSQMPEVNGPVTWTFDRTNTDDFVALDKGYWSYYYIGDSTSVNYKHLRGSGSYTLVQKTSSSEETVTTHTFAVDGITCTRDEEGRELFTLYVTDAYGNSTHALYFTFDSRYPLSGTGCSLIPGGWAIVKNDVQYNSYFSISSITFNGDGPNRSPLNDTDL